MPDEPRPQTDAIDAAVRAIDRAEEFGLGAISFRNALTGDPIRDVATLAVQAAEPLIRRQVAEEIAAELEALRDVRLPDIDIDWDCAPAIEQTLTHAAAIAREIGGRHA